MIRILFLIPESDRLVDGNYLRFTNELLNNDCEVCLCLVDSLALSHSQITASGWNVTAPINAGDPVPSLTICTLVDFDIVWLFSLGQRNSFLDKFQMLYTVGNNVRFINSLDSIMHLKSKYFIASMPEMIRHPETHAGCDPEKLLTIIEESRRTWVVKPPAGSLGRDVFLLKPENPNNRSILKYLCGQNQDQYTLLQEYIDEIENGETRVLFANGRIVGQYKRHAVNDHRTNLLQGAKSQPCSLTTEEVDYCMEIGTLLKSKGANFVGMDMAYPWVIEFNVINPGGLLTINQLTGVDLAPRIIKQLGMT